MSQVLRTRTGLHLIAYFEALKGILVLLAGLGLLSLLHHDVTALAEELAERGLLSHHHRLSGVLLRAAEDVTDRELWRLALVAVAYSTLRFIEAYGLWKQREWGELVAIVSGTICRATAMDGRNQATCSRDKHL